MKKIFIYIILFQLSFLSCKKSEVEPLFPDSANQRATNAVSGYKKQLTDAQYGWKGAYYPDGGQAGGYSFYLKFDATGKVTMYSDIDEINYSNGYKPYFSNGYDKAFETTFQVKALQKPTLIFDSYSYLHELVNPDYNGGTGQFADMELEFVSATDNTITLVGNVNKTQLVLTKITKIESDNLANGTFASVFNGTYNYANSASFLTLVLPTGDKADLQIDLNNKFLVLYFLNKSGNIDAVSSSFIVTTTGIQLKDPVTFGGTTFQEMFWDAALKLYYINVGGKRVNIVGASRPTLPFYYALGNIFVGFNMSPDIPSQTAEYKALYAKIKSNVIALSTAPPVRVIGNVYLQYLPNDGVFALVIEYKRTNPDGSLVFDGAGVLYYQPALDSKGNIKFTRLSQSGTLSGGQLANGISAIVSAGIKPLTDLLEGSTFMWDYDPVVTRTAVLKSNSTPSISIKGFLF